MVSKITISVFAMFIFLTSCINKRSENIESKALKFKEIKSEQKASKCDCEIFSLDTTFKNGDYVKCTNANNSCQYFVKIKQMVQSINDTNFSNNPYVFDHVDNSIIEVVDGNSSGGRDMIICEFLNDSIYVNRFHTYIPYNASKDIFVFKKVTNDAFVFVKERLNLNKDKTPEKKFRLPYKLQSLKIESSLVFENSIHVVFEGTNNELSIAFNALK